MPHARAAMPKSLANTKIYGETKRPSKRPAKAAPRAKAAPQLSSRSAAASSTKGPRALPSSPLLVALAESERRAVLSASSGKAAVIQSLPRARDAAVFLAAASVSSRPVLVASPLSSELFAQARANAAGIEVVALGRLAQDPAASRKRVLKGGRLLVVVAPAQLLDPALRELFAKVPPAILGVAAAHACSEHAHELSPAYLGLREIAASFGSGVLATCTATSPRVVAQVAEAVGATPSSVATARALELSQSGQVMRASERKAALLAAIQAYGAPGIVLTSTSQEVDAVYAELLAQGVACARAHAGMSETEREQALTRFTSSRDKLVLVTQSPRLCTSGLSGFVEAGQGLSSAAPRTDLSFVVHYQAPLSPEQLFEDLAWLPAGGASLVLADSSDAALVQALLAQQRIKPAAIESVAQALAQAPEDRPSFADTLSLRAGTSRRSAERVLCALEERQLISRENGGILRCVPAERLLAEARLLAARFAGLRAGDAERADGVARYVTGLHGTAPKGSASSGASQMRA